MAGLCTLFEKLIFTETPSSKKLKPTVLTFIGSGGKTTLIWHLAKSFKNHSRKILVITTTKMYRPLHQKKQYDFFCEKPLLSAQPGITLAGIYDEKTGKISSFPLPDLEQMSKAFDIVLIEGDGSHEHPLKGWAAHEPIVPVFTDFTVGIIPIWPLGQPISEKIIHRLPEFCALCSANPADILNSGHYINIISGNREHPEFRSLFSKTYGKKVLIINQKLCFYASKQSFLIINSLPADFSGKIDVIALANILKNKHFNIKH